MKFTCAEFAASRMAALLIPRADTNVPPNAAKRAVLRLLAGEASAGLFELAALNVAVALEHQAQPVERQVLVVVLDGAQVGQHQRRGVTGGHHCDVVAREAVDVL